jgi:4-amino-4-deoxy-L-arabinose transferase-like glycosyltransferase
MNSLVTILLAVALAVLADLALIRILRRRRQGPPASSVPRPSGRPRLRPLVASLAALPKRATHTLDVRVIAPLSRMRTGSGKLELTLFGLSMGIYMVTRFTGLDKFPIYFFTDEAVQTVLVSDFVRDGFRDFSGTVFPTYFQNASLYNLSLSVYLQLLPYLAFGKSILVTRGTAMLATAVGAFGLGLILKNIFRIRYWWAGVLFLSITPAWFLHSRTAFETTLMVSIYICFVYLYLLYRTRSPRYLYPCLVLGAMVFYSYSPGQLIIFASGLLLLLSDFRYHWRNIRTGLRGLALIVLLILPYVRFQFTHPGETVFHLRVLDSYLFHDISLSEKVMIFLANYVHGLSPAYWYLPNSEDLLRHVMKGYGNILAATFPLAVIGLIIAIRRIGESEYRTALIALFASPIGMALVGVGLTRVLVFVFPVALLTTIGVDPIGRLLGRILPRHAFAIALFVVLGGYNFYMLNDSLTNGPLWYTNYGLYGMQYGGQQVFGEVGKELKQSPGQLIFVSSSWANGADILRRFFLDDEDPVWMLDLDGLRFNKVQDIDKMLFVITPAEYQLLDSDPKFAEIQIQQTIPYPDGSPGFYFVHVVYSQDADAILAAERAERDKPVKDVLSIGGELVTVVHPAFDSGQVENLFDGDPFTLARSRKINPAVITMSFERPREIKGVLITTGTMDMTIVVRVYAGETAEPIEYTQTYFGLPEDPTVEIEFDDAPSRLTKVEISVKNLNADSEGNVHIREITFE